MKQFKSLWDNDSININIYRCSFHEMFSSNSLQHYQWLGKGNGYASAKMRCHLVFFESHYILAKGRCYTLFFSRNEPKQSFSQIIETPIWRQFLMVEYENRLYVRLVNNLGGEEWIRIPKLCNSLQKDSILKVFWSNLRLLLLDRNLTVDKRTWKSKACD